MSAALPSPHLCSGPLREERVYTLVGEGGGIVDCRQVAVELQHLPADLAAAKVGFNVKFVLIIYPDYWIED